MLSSGFVAASIQIRGSGATLPDHAHVSIFNETLPILKLESTNIGFIQGVGVERCERYPGVVLVLAHGDIHSRAVALTVLCRRLERHSLSYNLYIDSKARVVVVLRVRSHPISYQVKVGTTTAAGMYIPYFEDSNSKDAQVLQELMRSRWLCTNGLEVATSLRETVFQDDPQWLLDRGICTW